MGKINFPIRSYYVKKEDGAGPGPFSDAAAQCSSLQNFRQRVNETEFRSYK
jgi:hypothetical protein